MPDSDDIEMNEKFADLVFLALDHGVESVRESGGPLVPFVMFVHNDELMLQRFATELIAKADRSPDPDTAAGSNAPSGFTSPGRDK